MIENLPNYIALAFALTTLATLLLLVQTVKKSSLQKVRNKANIALVGGLCWLGLQAFLSFNHVYSTDTDSFPPKIMLLGIFPVMFTIILMLATKKGQEFTDSLPLKNLTYLHAVRIPVELVLFWLYLNKAVPELMTFEGRNFDIVAGITAPIVAYLGFTKRKIGRKAILTWNIICLLLLVNIVIHALLSTPSPIQKMAFEQPNIAILHFPFCWLPCFVAPAVLFVHLISIRQLIRNNESNI